MSFFLRQGAVIAPIMVLWAGSASAQDALPVKSIDWSATARAEYASNPLRLSPGETPAAGFHKSDRKYSLNAELNILYPIGRQALFLKSNIGYDFHERNTQLDRARGRAEAGADLNLLGNCHTIFSGDYGRQQSDLADINVSSGRVVNLETRWGLSANVRCGGPIGLTPAFRYRHEERTNSSSLRKPANVRSDDYTALLGYARPSLGVISLYGNYRDGSYPDRPLTDPMQGIKVYGGGIEFERNIGVALTGVVSVGYQHVNPQGVGVGNYNGISWSGAITWHPSERLQSVIELGRSAEQSNLFITSYSIRTYLNWETTFVVNDRLDLNSNFMIAHRKFKTNLIEAALNPDTQNPDTTWSMAAGANYKIGRIFRVGFDAAHEQRHSSFGPARYRDNRVAVTFGVAL